MQWDKLRIFHTVAEAGSFTRAGERLHLSQSAISRQVSALEDSLNTTLFHRHARGLTLTEQGELLYRTVHEVFAKLAMVEAVLTDSKERPKGELKVTTPIGFGSIWLTQRIRGFVDMYPDIRFNLIVTDQELDLSLREADVAIRLRKPTQSDLIMRKLTTVHYHIYASETYINRYGAPRSLDDLKRHTLVIYGKGVAQPVSNINWLIDELGGVPQEHPVHKVNNVYGLYKAIESGLGIGALPDYIIARKSRVIRILPSVEGPTFETYFVYPEELRNSKKIGVFRDYLIQKVSEWEF